MKKVLHVLTSDKFSGAENVVCTIIDSFKSRFNMAYCSPRGEIEKVLEKKDINYYPIKRNSLYNLKKVIKLYNPDIIHAHDYRASILVAFSGFKGKIISHLHNNVPDVKKWGIKSLLYSISSPKFFKVIGVSNQVYSEAVFKEKIKTKYLTIYNYVDKNNVIEKASIDSTIAKYDLFFIGRLTKAKNPFLFIEIVKLLKEKFFNISAVMIGDGELYDSCFTKIQEYGLTENIKMVGFCENPFPFIKNCRIGVMPSKWEGFGLTAIESMILNKPVFNSGVGGLSEIFANDKLFICNNLENYVEKISNELTKKTEHNFDKLVSRYCDQKEWYKSLYQIYNEGE